MVCVDNIYLFSDSMSISIRHAQRIPKKPNVRGKIRLHWKVERTANQAFIQYMLDFQSHTMLSILVETQTLAQQASGTVPGPVPLAPASATAPLACFVLLVAPVASFAIAWICAAQVWRACKTTPKICTSFSAWSSFSHTLCP